MPMLLYELVGQDAERPFSPHCWKVRMAIAHKRLAYETRPVPFTGIGAVEGGVSKIVPILRDGDTVVSDSFAIAEYLERSYPDRPSLFGGEGGRALARFVEAWSMRVIHPFIGGSALTDIHAVLAPTDQAYFRQSREQRFGRPLEEVPQGREERLPAFRQSLEPLRAVLDRQLFLGGETPLFADHIVFGAFQWLRVASSFAVLEADDPIAAWFEACLDLYDGLGRKVPAAAA
ncbi:glutathione S-transferase family protein [Mangrovibrevibacter kandeliae]|uniref:glutathione S-transferase family protein n=1 Tax=Mangrovibrevibacter kandeliae TaxID=2968473 RepID=UPI00211855CA|nr:glutathione S-transferase family protein [Aurantimonas sp. CSK15Z-1]MCQ8781389.1 glutathione S-transferase family protein [Aurantimonas sp. CSK15Z-1]